VNPLARVLRLMSGNGQDAMNHPRHGADRAYLTTMVVGLPFATLVACIGLSAHLRGTDLGTAALVKAGQPTAVSWRMPAVRATAKYAAHVGGWSTPLAGDEIEH
jgi:hypothetical protein